MKTGIIYDEPFPDYAATDCVGSHRLEDLLPYPIRYKLRWIDRTLPQPPESEDFLFGRYFHSLALEGEHLTKARYIVMPEDMPPRPTIRLLKAEKPSDKTMERVKRWIEFEKEAAGRTAITQEESVRAAAMVESMRAVPSLVRIFEHGAPEVTFRHKMPHFGIQSRIDWFDEKGEAAGPHIYDLKTIAELESFDYQYHKYGYYRQAAFYRLVVARVLGVPSSMIQFSFIAIEKQPPYLCARRDPDAQSIAKGEDEVIEKLKWLKRCYETNFWPGPLEISPVSLPEWMTRHA